MLQLAMYKGEGEFFDKCVRWRTDSIYSHCELVVAGTAFSSSIRDGGVRTKIIFFNPLSWDLFTVRDKPELTDKLFSHMSACQGMPYDWKGILIGQVFGTRAASSNKRYCSAFCGEVLLNYRHHSPQALLEACRKADLLVE